MNELTKLIIKLVEVHEDDLAGVLQLCRSEWNDSNFCRHKLAGKVQTLISPDLKDVAVEGRNPPIQVAILRTLFTSASLSVEWMEVSDYFLTMHVERVNRAFKTIMGRAAEAQELIESEGEPPLCHCGKGYEGHSDRC